MDDGQGRDFARAARDLRQAVCFAPSNARAWHELGLAEAASGDFQSAEASLAKAERLAPQDIGVLLSRAQAQLSLDRVWTHPASMLKKIEVHRSPLARVASDHLPLVATISP